MLLPASVLEYHTANFLVYGRNTGVVDVAPPVNQKTGPVVLHNIML